MLSLAEFCYWTRKMQARFFAGDFAAAAAAAWAGATRCCGRRHRKSSRRTIAFMRPWPMPRRGIGAAAEGKALHVETLDSAPRAARGVGRALSGQLRGPHHAGPRRSRAYRGQACGRGEALRNSGAAGTRERLGAQLRRCPTNWRVASTRRVASKGSRRPTSAMRAPAIRRWGADAKVRQLEQRYPQIGVGRGVRRCYGDDRDRTSSISTWRP